MLSKSSIFWVIVSISTIANTVFAQKKVAANSQGKVIFSDDFSKPLESGRWISELEAPERSRVYTDKGSLVIDAAAGATVWYKMELQGNITIEYDWTVRVDSGKNDRLSDLNQFWMATDPRRTDLFTRHGKFDSYDSLQLYYVGFGGNRNTTTRFRKYYGDGQKPLVKEYLDAPHLLVANHKYHIIINVNGGRTTFAVDGNVIFDYVDQKPLTRGYFGFRATSARHSIDNFSVTHLD